MAEHGGYRQPSKPAAVSGPGKYSRRTDGKQPIRDLTGGSYGSGQEFENIQSGAPMAASGEVAEHAATQNVPAFTPLDAEGDGSIPITSGTDVGAGVGADALGLPPEDGSQEDLRARLGGMLPVLVRIADSGYSTQQYKDDVRELISRM